MVRPIVSLLTLAVLLTAAYAVSPAAPGTGDSATGTPAASAGALVRDIHVTAIPCPAWYDSGHDGVCIGYDGQVPGPTLVYHQGDSVVLRVHNDIAATIGNVTDDPFLIADLSAANVTLHRHGIILPNGADGVASPPGSAIPDSSIGPGLTLDHPFVTAFPGAWHYHDHTMFHPDQSIDLVHYGLFGTMVVLPVDVADTNALDLHLMNDGPVVAPSLAGPHPAGERIDLAVTALGDWTWDVTLEGPGDAEIGRLELGPGLSRAITLDDPPAGTYTWTATSAFVPGSPFSGEVVVS